MADLDAAIRATLDAWAQPADFIESTRVLDAEEYADLVARFQAAQQRPHELLEVTSPTVTPPFDRMRAGLLGVLELKRRVSEDWTHVNETSYELGLRSGLEQAVDVIAEALGIEVEAP